MPPIREDRPSVSSPHQISRVADWFAFTLLSIAACEASHGRLLLESFLVATALAVVGLAVYGVHHRSSGRNDVLGWIFLPFLAIWETREPWPLPLFFVILVYCLIVLLPTAWLVGRMNRMLCKAKDGFAGTIARD